MSFITICLNFLFPPRCVSCRKEGDFLCIECINTFKISNLAYRQAGLESFKNTPAQKESFKYLNGVIYGMSYANNPGIQAAIRQFKYKFTQELAEYFSDILMGKLKELSMINNKSIVLIPVPLHKKRLNYRGFNQAEILSQAISNNIRGQVTVHNYLRRIKNTSQQAKLNKVARRDNLNQAFSVTFNATYLDNTIYFVVDDVFTTGSTLESCAEVLKKSGFKKVYGLVVARSFKT